MTWRHLSAYRIGIIRFLCGMAERLSLADLYQNAVDAGGHRFIPTAFRLPDAQGGRIIYYCRCGQLAIRRNGGIGVLNDQASVSDPPPCKYFTRGKQALRQAALTATLRFGLDLAREMASIPAPTYKIRQRHQTFHEAFGGENGSLRAPDPAVLLSVPRVRILFC